MQVASLEEEEEAKEGDKGGDKEGCNVKTPEKETPQTEEDSSDESSSSTTEDSSDAGKAGNEVNTTEASDVNSEDNDKASDEESDVAKEEQVPSEGGKDDPSSGSMSDSEDSEGTCNKMQSEPEPTAPQPINLLKKFNTEEGDNSDSDSSSNPDASSNPASSSSSSDSSDDDNAPDSVPKQGNQQNEPCGEDEGKPEVTAEAPHNDSDDSSSSSDGSESETPAEVAAATGHMNNCKISSPENATNDNTAEENSSESSSDLAELLNQVELASDSADNSTTPAPMQVDDQTEAMQVDDQADSTQVTRCDAGRPSAAAVGFNTQHLSDHEIQQRLEEPKKADPPTTRKKREPKRKATLGKKGRKLHNPGPTETQDDSSEEPQGLVKSPASSSSSSSASSTSSTCSTSSSQQIEKAEKALEGFSKIREEYLVSNLKRWSTTGPQFPLLPETLPSRIARELAIERLNKLKQDKIASYAVPATTSFEERHAGKDLMEEPVLPGPIPTHRRRQKSKSHLDTYLDHLEPL